MFLYILCNNVPHPHPLIVSPAQLGRKHIHVFKKKKNQKQTHTRNWTHITSRNRTQAWHWHGKQHDPLGNQGKRPCFLPLLGIKCAIAALRPDMQHDLIGLFTAAASLCGPNLSSRWMEGLGKKMGLRLIYEIGQPSACKHSSGSLLFGVKGGNQSSLADIFLWG